MAYNTTRRRGSSSIPGTHLHHVECFGGVNEDAVQHIQHAGALASRAQTREEPVKSVTVGELRTVGVVALDDGGQQLVEVTYTTNPRRG